VQQTNASAKNKTFYSQMMHMPYSILYHTALNKYSYSYLRLALALALVAAQGRFAVYDTNTIPEGDSLIILS
jgi:hypothetical protein